jgi:histidine ammonia-lyase
LDYRQPLKPARHVGEAHAVIRQHVRSLAQDRILAPDIAALADAIRNGEFDAWRD